MQDFYRRLFRWNEKRWRTKGAPPADDAQLAEVVKLAYPQRDYPGTLDVAGWRRRYNRGELGGRRAGKARSFRYYNVFDSLWAQKGTGKTKTATSPELPAADVLSAVLAAE